MDMQNVIYAVAVLFIMGIVFAILLGVAAKVFAVEVDERVPLVRECLPGANCGGCGFPGCDGLAAAIVEGRAPVNGCPVGGAAAAEKIAKVLGVEVAAGERQGRSRLVQRRLQRKVDKAVLRGPAGLQRCNACCRRPEGLRLRLHGPRLLRQGVRVRRNPHRGRRCKGRHRQVRCLRQVRFHLPEEDHRPGIRGLQEGSR